MFIPSDWKRDEEREVVREGKENIATIALVILIVAALFLGQYSDEIINYLAK